jgi:hypothetical protein
VGSIPTLSRHALSQGAGVNFSIMSRSGFLVIAALALLSLPVRSESQVPDSGLAGLRKTVAATTPDSVRPPISARRAFLSSFILPGYGQTRLDRPRAAMLFSVAEVLSIGMAMKAQQDLREVKRIGQDSVPGTFTLTGSTQVPATFLKGRFNADRLSARRTHYEDWIAAIVFNHLLSGADAYVAANLWDFGSNIRGTASTSGFVISATLAW